jgi:hypothetical protein
MAKPTRKRSDAEAARLLLEDLEGEGRVDAELDARMLDYVLAELAGVAVHEQYPAVRRYILSSEHASQLYEMLLETEQAAQAGELPVLTRRKFDPDFLKSAPTLQQRVTELAEKLIKLLRPKKELKLNLHTRAFFKARAGLPEQFRLQGLPAHAFGALGPNVPEELRWLEAVYEVLVQLDIEPGSDVSRIAARAAENAGLASELRSAFVRECVNRLK